MSLIQPWKRRRERSAAAGGENSPQQWRMQQEPNGQRRGKNGAAAIHGAGYCLICTGRSGQAREVKEGGTVPKLKASCSRRIAATIVSRKALEAVNLPGPRRLQASARGEAALLGS